MATYRVFGEALATGNTLMVPTDPGNEEVNNHLLDSSEGFISGFPCNGELEGAFLFWTGSTDLTTDDTADIMLADGTPLGVVADQCFTVPSMGGFYYCRADITSELRGHTTACGYNGMYTVGGVEAMEGDYNSPDPGNGPCFAQGKYAAWSMILVYSDSLGHFRRDVVIYDGFLQLDEDSYNPGCGMTNPTPGVDSFSIGGFEVGNPPRGKLIIFGLEGDDQLGIPPQTNCTNCYDYLMFNGTKLFDSANYPNNLFNGSTSVTGVDIDEFDIGETGFNLLQPGQTVANIEVGSGDGCVSYSDPGCPPETEGGGESFFLGWMVVSLDTLSPLFVENTTLQFDEHTVGVGSVVGASIRIQNDGNLPATDVTAWNTLPAGLEYVPDSTSLDGVPVPDVGGTGALYTPQGLYVGYMDYIGPSSTKVIRLQVRVKDDQSNGSLLCSDATVDCNETEPVQSQEDCLTVEAPDIADPTLEVQDVNGGFAEPGDLLRYRARLTNNGSLRADGLRFTMDLPPWVKGLNIISRPPESEDFSTQTGGANGTGFLDVRAITLHGNNKDSVEIVFDVTVFTEQELLDAGVASQDIDGLTLPAQGWLSGPPLDQDLPTNLVVVTLTYRPILDGTRKFGTDVNADGRVEPGDLLRYTVEVHNVGNRAATVDITDDLPAGVINCSIVSGPPGASCVPPPAGVNGTGQVVATGFAVPPDGGVVSLVFEVEVAADAADGLQITNRALVEVFERPEENRTVFSQPFTVFHRPDFLIAEKTVQDLNGPPVEPGDPLSFGLRYVNQGNRTATNVVVSDGIDPNLIDVVPGQGGIFDGTRITWNLPPVDPGEEILLGFTANIVSPLANATQITNRGALNADELTDPVETNLVTLTVVSAPDLSTTTKEVSTQDMDGDGQVSPGDRVDYSIVVRNTGNSVATNVTVTDAVDANLEDVQVGQGGVLSGGTITWNPGTVDLSPGGDVILTFSATIVTPLVDGTIISNQAFAAADGVSGVPSDDPSTPQPDDPTNIVVRSQALVTVSKTVTDPNGGEPMPGDTLNWQIVIENNGNAPATGLVVTDILAGELTNPVAGQGGQVAGNSISWNSAGTPELASVVPGNPVTLNFVADLIMPLADGTVVCNQATVNGGGLPGPVVSDSACITVRSYPVLTASTKIVTDLDGDGHFNPGDRVSYQIEVRNTGTEVVNNVQVSDSIDINLSNIVAGQGGVQSGGSILWNGATTPQLASMAPGDTVALGFEADIVLPLANGTPVSNQGVIDGNELTDTALTDDPTTPEMNDPTVFIVESAPDLTAATKNVEDLTGDPGVVEPGDTLRYTIQFANTGTETATGLIVSDIIDPNLENVAPGQNGILDGAAIRWDSATTGSLASLSPVDPPVTLIFTAQVKVPTQNGTVISNQGQIVRDGNAVPVPTDDPRTADEDDPTDVVVVSGANLTASSKVAYDQGGTELPPAAAVSPGQVVQYEIVLRNDGNDAARNVEVRDPLDLSLVEVIDIGQGGRLVGQEIRYNYLTNPAQLSRIDPGQEVNLTFTVSLVTPLDDGTLIDNQAFIIGEDIAVEVPTDDLRTASLDDPVRLTVSSASDLSASTKTVEDLNGGDFVPGDTVRYRIRLQNTGDAMARDVVVLDPVDTARLENIQPDQGGVLTSGVIRWDAASTPQLAAVGLSPQGDVELGFTAAIKIPLDDGTLVSNQASIQAQGAAPVPTDDPSTADPDDPTTFQVSSAADLEGMTKIVQDIDGGDPVPGDLLTYTIEVNNQGTMTARNVTVTDPVDEVNLVDITPMDGGSLTAGVVTWDPASNPALAGVDPGEMIALRFTARIRSLTQGGTEISNQSQAVSETGTVPVVSDDPATAELDDPTRIVVVASPEFGESLKTVSDTNGAPLLPGETLDFNLTITNNGNTFATQVVVVDPLSQVLENVQPGQGGRLEGDRIVWDPAVVPALSRLDPGEQVVLGFQATVSADATDGTSIVNRGEITCVELASTQYTNQVEIVVQTPVLGETTKVVNDLNGAPFEPGDSIRYTLTVVNTGSLAATSVRVTDPVDMGNLQEISPMDGGILSGNEILWDLSSLPAGGEVQLSFTARIVPLTPGGTRVDNQALVTANQIGEPVLSDDPSTPAVDDPTGFIVEAEPRLSESTKTVEDLDGGVVKPGDILRYTLVVRNSGNTWADNVVVNDPVDTDHLEEIQPGQGGVLVGPIIRWDSDSNPALARMGLSPDSDLSLTFTARVKQDVPNGTVIANQAIFSCDQTPNPVPSDDPSTPTVDDPTEITVIAAPHFPSSRKEVEDLNGDLVEPGDHLEYTVLVVNDGSENATDTIVRDSIPARSSYLAGSTTLNGQIVPDLASGESPLVQGMSVRSARPGTGDGVVLVDDGSGMSDAVAVVTFRVQVEAAGSVCGATIANKAWIWSSQTDPAETNVAEVTVGACPNLNRTIKGWYLVEDNGTSGLVEPGDVVGYQIAIANTGATNATDVVFTDAMPTGASYRPNTLSLNGMTLSDAADTDAGEVLGGLCSVRVGSISPGAIARIEFHVLVNAGPRLVNQGTVASAELSDEPTDDDGDETNGDNPTIIPVGDTPKADLSGTRKSVEDLNGGTVLPGDELRYTIRVINAGSADARSIRVDDGIPDHTQYLPNSLERDGRSISDASDGDEGEFNSGSRRVVFSLNQLDSGEESLLSFRVRIGAETELGTLVENFASVTSDQIEAFETNHVVVVVGGGPGTGGVKGRVFIEMGSRNGSFDEGVDVPLEGYQVNLFTRPAQGQGILVASGTSGADGKFHLMDLEPGTYSLRAFTSTGVELVEHDLEGADAIMPDQVNERDLPVDPSGRIYDATDARLLPGTTVSIYYDEEDPVSPGQKVPLDRLVRPSQQDQLTDQYGLYMFDLETGHRYKLAVAPPSPSWIFPSARIPPQEGFATDLLEGGKVVEADIPDPGGDNRYYLRFDIGEEVHNNHIPMDRLDGALKLAKHVNKRVASVGDIVTYTITLQNGSGQDLEGDWTSTGVWIRDRTPRGFAYLDRSARVDVIAPDGKVQTLGQNNTPSGSGTRGRLLEFGPYPLGAGETLRVRYHMALGSDVPIGEHDNRATAFIQGGVVASNQATARVRVVYDPVFDEALVIGKVFCDRDEDGLQNVNATGDMGIPGARVYLDTGWYAETDDTGKYHLKGIDPGLHLLKIDSNTLPPGSEVIGAEAKTLHLTRGLPAKLNFPVRCTERVVTASPVKEIQGPEPRTVLLTGDLDGFGLVLQERPVELPELRLWIGKPDATRTEEIFTFDVGQAVDFALQASDEDSLERWTLEITGPGGKLVDAISGNGSPGHSLTWDPPDKHLDTGTYLARLRITEKNGTEVHSGPVAFGVGIPPAEVDVPIYPARLKVNGKNLELGDVSSFSYQVPVLRGDLVEIDFTRANGERVTTRLLAEGPPERRAVDVQGDVLANRLAVSGEPVPVLLEDLDVLLKDPENAPLLLSDTGLAKPAVFEIKGDRSAILSWSFRIEDSSSKPVHHVEGTGPPQASLSFEGKKLTENRTLSEGWYRYYLQASAHDGTKVRTPIRLLFAARPPEREELPADELFAGRTARPTRALKEKMREVADLLRKEEGSRLRIEVHTDNTGGPVRAAKRTRSLADSIQSLALFNRIPGDRIKVEAMGGEQPKLPNIGARNKRANRRVVFEITRSVNSESMPLVTPSMELKLDGKPLQADGSGSFKTEVMKLPGDRLQLLWDDPDGRRFEVPYSLAGAEPARTAEAQPDSVNLEVRLPPEGVKIRSETLVVRGKTDPGNRVEVNGKPATVDKQGQFIMRLPVSADTREVAVVATHPDGRKSEVRSPIEVAKHVWFLMAMADTAVAELEAGQHLEGVTKRTSTVIEDKVLLHGRAVLYLKARLKGKYLFDQYRITAHFDTAKGDEEAFFEQIVDPERYYPVYGDSGAEVQDVNARRKLYVLIEADESLVKVGNFRTEMKGIELLRYDRTFYGGKLVLKKDLGKGFDTEVRAHVTDGSEQVLHAHVELAPTGGSLYYLPHTFVLEGSEQVTLTVRDRETGMILMRIPKQRDIDYTVRYREGRILFKGPVASALEAGGVAMSSDFSLPAEGNPVVIEVDYEYEGGRGPGEISWAVQAHETWRDTVRVGGSYIREGRQADDFVLWGVDLTLQDPDNKATYLKGEFARSEHTDADNFVSADGGLSFTSLGTSDPARYGRPESGDAWKIAAGSEIGPYLGKTDPFLNLSGYFQWIQPGFFSNGMLTEQGQKKFGGRVSYHLTADGTLDVRHDGALTTMFLAGTEREINRQVSRLGYTHRFGDLDLGLDYLHGMSEDSSLDTGFLHTDAMGARAKYRFTKRWEGFVQQEAILHGDDMLVGSFGDRMKTSLGVNYKLTDTIDLTLSERVRWSGENATVIGISTRLSEKAKIYANERFHFGGGRYVSTTVLGAEDEPLKGVRTYGEYQLNGASSGTTNRAVLGLNNHFNWGKGWSLDLHYERTQVFGDGGYGPGTQLTDGTGSGMLPDGIGGGTGFEGVPGQAMPGMNSYGSFLAGDASRDALGAGLEFKGLENLRISLKFEFRYDDADNDLITATGFGLARPGLKDRLQFLGMAALSWKWTEDLSFALRLNFADTESIETEKDGLVYVEEGTEARIIEGSAGVAFRPVHYDWVALLGKYTILLERRPLDLVSGLSEQSESHVFTIMPIFELPLLRLQLVEKFAWKFVREKVDGLPDGSGHTILWINRLNFHILDELDVGGEYRMLKSWLADDFKHGFLVEVAYVLLEKVRIGAGYNFTSFSDNEFARNDYDHGGFFFRVVGQY